MKILYVITGLTVGGAETITINLAYRMVLVGNKVKIMYLSGKQEIQVTEEIETINLCIKKSLFGFIKSMLDARKIIKDFKPEIVHANMFHAIIFSRLLRLFVKIPRLICTEHSNNYHGKARLILEHCTDFLSDLNTNVSQIATDYFVKSGVFSQKKSIVMYNGVDMNCFFKNRNTDLRQQLNIAENDFVFINVSRFNKAKDHKSLIDAFNIVHQKKRNSKLICVGDGELRTEMQIVVEDLNLSDSIVFAGIQQNVHDYYNASDCFVLSSFYEGFGLVLVEAMACELPVISTDCGGTKEIVANKNDLVPIKNPELLADKMLEVMNYTVDQKETVGRQNRAAVEKFDLNKITEKWEKLYKEKLV